MVRDVCLTFMVCLKTLTIDRNCWKWASCTAGNWYLEHVHGRASRTPAAISVGHTTPACAGLLTVSRRRMAALAARERTRSCGVCAVRASTLCALPTRDGGADIDRRGSWAVSTWRHAE